MGLRTPGDLKKHTSSGCLESLCKVGDVGQETEWKSCRLNRGNMSLRGQEGMKRNEGGS